MAAEARQRRGGRSARRKERIGAPIVQKRYITREIPVYELLDEVGLDLIHDSSNRFVRTESCLNDRHTR